ncbi:MAG: hypothetical protein K2Y23_03575 [Cyanobacteria bacterium]|nr:hypothetical protein [Cyanobacteriota bacterium]
MAVEIQVLEVDAHPARASVGSGLSFLARAIDSGTIVAGTMVNAGAEHDTIAALHRSRDQKSSVRIAGVRRLGCQLSEERRSRYSVDQGCIALNPVVEVGDHDLRRSFRPILGLLETDTADQFHRNRLVNSSVPKPPAWPHEFLNIVIEFGPARDATLRTSTVRATAYTSVDESLLGDVEVLFVDGTEPQRRLSQLPDCGKLRLLASPLGGLSRTAVAIVAFAVFPVELPRVANCPKQRVR